MSILTEYAEIRQRLGEEKFQGIERYLELHPNLLLSDVYYNPKEWECFERWYQTQDVSRETPINLLQRLIDRAKMDYIVVYQDNDNQVIETDPALLNTQGNLCVKKGLMLVDYEEKIDGKIIAQSVEGVMFTLDDWGIFDAANCNEAELKYIFKWLEETFKFERRI